MFKKIISIFSLSLLFSLCCFSVSSNPANDIFLVSSLNSDVNDINDIVNDLLADNDIILDGSDPYQIVGFVENRDYYTFPPVRCVGFPCLPIVFPFLFLSVGWGGVCFGLTRLNFCRYNDFDYLYGYVSINGERCDQFIAHGFKGVFVFLSAYKNRGDCFLIQGSAKEIFIY